MRGTVTFALVALVVVLRAQQPADQSAAAVRAAPDLQAVLWASEPAVTNPTNITVDERGRVWVLEAVNYRRTTRSQPDLQAGGDRIVILEDADRDGRAERAKVFDQNPSIRAPLGIAVLGDKVYVSQSPNLTVYTKDTEDRIVSKEVLLTGFGGEDHDHGLHAVVFGPDGKLYFNHGNTGFTVKDRSGKTLQGSSYLNDPLNSPTAGFFQGVALRMNRDGTNLEVLAQNFRNPYELALDSFGNVFQTDNDDDGNAWTRLSYVMDGGNYGYRGPLHRSWNEDRGTHFHNELPGVVPNVLRLGPGSPCGLLVYEGTLLPARYRGWLVHAEAGKRIVAGYPLKADGAGFGASVEDIVFGGTDTWFRPSDVAVAPDGSLFVADWYDPGVGGHNMGDPNGGRGRIYRVAPPKARPDVPAVDLGTEAGLVAAFGSPNQSVRYLAHLAIEKQGAAAAPLLQKLWRGDNSILRARALWLLGGLPKVGSAAIADALKDADARFRILGLRVAKLHGSHVLTVSKPLLRDPSPQVRREIAIQLRDADPARMIPPYLMGAQSTPSPGWMEAMTQLLAHYDGNDRWYLEALAIAARGREDAVYARIRTNLTLPLRRVVWALRPNSAIPDLIATANDSSRPMVERELAVATLGSMEWAEATRAVEAVVLANTTPPALVERAFSAYSRQLASLWTDARKDPAYLSVVRKAFATPESQGAAVELVTHGADTQFLPDLLALATRETAPAEARTAAIDALATTADQKYVDPFRELAAAGPTPVRVAAVRGVSSLQRPEFLPWAQALVVGDAPNEVRVEALRLMAATAPGLTAILDLAEAGKLPAELRTVAASLTNNAGLGRGRGFFGRGRGGFAPGGRGGGPGTPPGEGRGGMPPSPDAPAGPGRGAPAAAGQPPGPGGFGPGGFGRGGTPDPAMVAVRERAAKVLPLRATAAGPLPNIMQLERDYRGSAAAGRTVFQTDAGCAACHAVGGNERKVGPDLSAIGLKFGKQAMLDHIVRPNDAIAHEYVVTVFELSSGEIVSGVVTEDTPAGIAVRVNETNVRRLKPSDVRARQQSRTSLMPEGLLDALMLQQVSDLLEFLATLNAGASR